jgi:hypothetical protein
MQCLHRQARQLLEVFYDVVQLRREAQHWHRVRMQPDLHAARELQRTQHGVDTRSRIGHKRQIGGVGHNLPQEAPRAFAQAIIDVDTLSG